MQKQNIMQRLISRLSWAFVICLSVSIALIIAGFIVPPLGVTDNSVLTAVGELFLFASLAVLSSSKAKKVSVSHGQTKLEMSNEITYNDPE